MPDHPAYQQILAALADTGRPMRARDLREARDLPILPKNTEGIRSKLKHLVTRSVLAEPEPGLFAQSHAQPAVHHADQGPSPNSKPETGHYLTFRTLVPTELPSHAVRGEPQRS